MLQPDCDQFLTVIDQLTLKITAIDDQIQSLVNEGMEQLHPWQYLKLQPQIDHLLKEQRILQMQWYCAMDELAICRSTPTLNAMRLHPS